MSLFVLYYYLAALADVLFGEENTDLKETEVSGSSPPALLRRFSRPQPAFYQYFFRRGWHGFGRVLRNSFRRIHETFRATARRMSDHLKAPDRWEKAWGVVLILALIAILLLRGVQAIERLTDPPEEDEGPFDYYAAEAKRSKRRRSSMYGANKDLHLPE